MGGEYSAPGAASNYITKLGHGDHYLVHAQFWLFRRRNEIRRRALYHYDDNLHSKRCYFVVVRRPGAIIKKIIIILMLGWASTACMPLMVGGGVVSLRGFVVDRDLQDRVTKLESDMRARKEYVAYVPSIFLETK